MRRLIFSLICSSRKAVNVPKPASVGITREDDYRYDCLFPGYVSQSKRLS